MKEIWIGLVDMKISKNTRMEFSQDVIGAVTNFLVYATSYDEWFNEVMKYLEYYHLHLLEVEDVEPLRLRRCSYEIPDELNPIIEKLEKTGIPQTTVFQTYRNT